ncbi:MAG: lipid A export permease/ATP-binding protein MsbA [Steroidobacteraceae bacterium]
MSAAGTPAVDGGKVYRRLLRYAWPHRGLFAIGLVGMLVFALTDVTFIWFVEKYLLSALSHPDPRLVWMVPAGVLVLFLLRGLADYVATYFPGRVGRQVIKDVRADLFAQYLHLPVRFYDRMPVGTSLSRLTYNVELVAEATTNSITILVRDSVTVVGLIAYMVTRSWKLTLLALVVAPLIGWVVRVINRQFRRYSARIQESMGDVTRFAKEALEAQRVVKVFGAARQLEQRFDEINERNRRSNVKLVNAKAASSPVVQMVASLGLAVVLAVAISQIVAGQMRPESLVAFIGAMMMVMAPLKRLANVGGALQQGIAAGISIFEVLDAPREPEAGGRPLARAQGRVEYRGVEFTYPDAGEVALRGVNLRVEPGQTLAIVGKSGGGKSTLVGMLPRFHDVDGGAILVDGVDIREWSLADLRRQISYVGQEVVLFDDSIRNNLTLGLEDVDPARIEAAARAAHVLEFAAALPGGLDAPVGERGGQLSGGQRQRVAIARAILKDAPILILDEATSALDTESERHIQLALAQLMHGRTTLVIAHRLSTVEQADCIVVVDQGRIAEAGTHADLLAGGGLYAQLHRLQFDA